MHCDSFIFLFFYICKRIVFSALFYKYLCFLCIFFFFQITIGAQLPFHCNICRSILFISKVTPPPHHSLGSGPRDHEETRIATWNWRLSVVQLGSWVQYDPMHQIHFVFFLCHGLNHFWPSNIINWSDWKSIPHVQNPYYIAK